MADPVYLAGTVYLTRNGQNYALVGKLAYRPSGNNVETLTGVDGVHGPKATPMPGMIKGTLRDSGSISVKEISSGINDSIVVNLINGKTIVGRNMWRVGEPPEVDTDEGTFDIQWEGRDVSEN